MKDGMVVYSSPWSKWVWESGIGYYLNWVSFALSVTILVLAAYAAWKELRK